MVKNRNGVALFMALVLALCGIMTCAQAEETDLSALTPLVDLTASAAMRVGESSEMISADSTLSQAFVYNFFLIGQKADASLGITADMLTDTSKQAAYLKSTFSCGVPALEGILGTGENYDYIGVCIMDADLSADGKSVRLIGNLYQANGRLDRLTEDEYAEVRWLDKRAVMDLVKDSAAPLGWKVSSFSVDAELDMEETTLSYFNETMVEYINTNLGFAIQYPAVFTDDTLTESSDGISAKLADGTASFFARKTSNTSSWTLAKVIEARKQQDADADTIINEISGCGRVVTQQDGHTVVDIYIVTSQWVYQAQLTYANSLAMDFSLYSDYMMNSFSADELGIG